MDDSLVLRDILAVLTEIRDMMKSVMTKADDDLGDPILVNESTACCPECGSPQVDLGSTQGHAIYRCKECERVWVNDEAALSN